MDQETTRLSRLIVRDIVNLFYTDKPSSLKRKVLTYKSVWGFYVSALVSKQNISKARTGNAAYHPKSNNEDESITLEIQLPKFPEKSGLSDLVSTIKQTLRHEIEHAKQEQRGGTIAGSHGQRAYDKLADETVYTRSMGALNYFLRPSEVEAYTMQLYKLSKMKKQPFLISVEQWLEKLNKAFEFPDNAKKAVVSSIRRAIVTYAKTRLPAKAFLIPKEWIEKVKMFPGIKLPNPLPNNQDIQL